MFGLGENCVVCEVILVVMFFMESKCLCVVEMEIGVMGMKLMKGLFEFLRLLGVVLKME